MKNLLFITDFTPKSSQAFRNIFPLSKRLGMKLKIIYYSGSEETKIPDNQPLIKEKISWFAERALGFRPPKRIKGMGLEGSLRRVISETGRYFDLIAVSNSIDGKLLRKTLFEEGNFKLPCPLLLLPDTDSLLELKKIIYVGAQFNELNWGLRRQLRNICRRSDAELQVVKPLPEKDRWFFNKQPLNETKFLKEFGWFRRLFFDNLKKHIKKEKIDVAIVSTQSLNASWLSKRMFVWRTGRLGLPILVLPKNGVSVPKNQIKKAA